MHSMTSRRSRSHIAKARHSADRGGNQNFTLGSHPYALAGAIAVGALAVSALVNRHLTKKAEKASPPAGKFLEVDGILLHYVERGEGEPLVLLHGNGSMIQDFETSGLVDMAAKKYRVIVFDRPGFGYSERPRGTVWTADAQADLLAKALAKIGVSRAVVLGHSWGASVAIALALKYGPMVKALILASGYYYPTVRADVVALSGPAVPVLGDVVRYTISPLLGRLTWPLLMRKMFGPAPMPEKFEAFPSEMTRRPSQIRASAAESALMIPGALAMRAGYGSLKMPVVIIAGEDDRIIDTDDQSAQLHRAVRGSTFHSIAGTGHMVHQTATKRVMAAINEAAAHGRDPGSDRQLRPLAA
jgi:pimeloyl-ACP methyl ester carboxylesterase